MHKNKNKHFYLFQISRKCSLTVNKLLVTTHLCTEDDYNNGHFFDRVVLQQPFRHFPIIHAPSVTAVISSSDFHNTIPLIPLGPQEFFEIENFRVPDVIAVISAISIFQSPRCYIGQDVGIIKLRNVGVLVTFPCNK